MAQPGLTFRMAAPADAPAVLALVTAAYRGDSARAGWTHEADLLDGPRTDAALILEAIETEGDGVILAFRGGELAGCVQATDEADAGRLYLGMLAVRPDLQAEGVGRALIDQVERLARRLGRARVRLSVLKPRTELIAYYQRRGYRLTGADLPFHDDPRFGLPRMPLRLVVMDKKV